MDQSRSVEEKRRFWSGHLHQWNSSGLSQAQYCRENGLSIKTFGYWKRQLGMKSAPVTLVEVPVVQHRPAFSSFKAIRLLVGNQVRIEVERDFDANLLDQLLRFLEQR